MIDRDELVRRSYELRPLSPTVVRLATLVADIDADIGEITAVVAHDPALAGALLRFANSARYGSKEQVGTVRDAVIRIGSGTVLQVAMKASIKKLAEQPLLAYGLTEGAFWRHCCAASAAAELIRRRCRTREVPREAATAALLHDIGKLLLAQLLTPDVLGRLPPERDAWSGPEGAAVERDVLGVCHAEVGGLIAQHWRLPDSIHMAITQHHSPEAGRPVLAELLAVADAVALRAFAHPGHRVPASDGELFASFGLSEKSVQEEVVPWVREDLAAAME
jgi:putative nucleotidyltransferase with HDIG domain